MTVCKVFVTVLIFSIEQVYLHSTPLECESRCESFSIHILLRWSKEASLEIKTSSRQRRDMSIEIKSVGSCHSSGVLCALTKGDRDKSVSNGTLPKYLHTLVL